MSYHIEYISETEFKINTSVVYIDHNNKWVANPPIEDQAMRKVVNNYIHNLSHAG